MFDWIGLLFPDASTLAGGLTWIVIGVVVLVTLWTLVRLALLSRRFDARAGGKCQGG